MWHAWEKTEMLTGLWFENLKGHGPLGRLTRTWRDINMNLKEKR
jgi:hypothetical protein